MIAFRKHRFALILMSLSTIFVAVVPLFLVAGCRPLQQSPAELKARETLRAMTRGEVLPAEDAVARIEKEFPNTTAGALARIVHARIRLKATDFAGAASLLDGKILHDYTVIGDYALWMRGNTLENLTRYAEARTAYEQLTRDYPHSLRAREATLHIAQMELNEGVAASVPATLAPLVAKDDAAALLLTAKAQEQNGNSTGALAFYRRIYFYTPAAIEAGEAATAITRLKSSTVAANAAEGL
ncbi:MAG TPA: tetratricopeptide repeat protein, partial [Pyrinomonadaceae bacterium]|nr:tetratricopeptide repeat protein [Pyrinomonadaceae bacterium]